MAKKKLWSKEFWKSKTVWANGLVILGGVASALAGELQGGAALTFIGVANVVLRVVTKSELKWK